MTFENYTSKLDDGEKIMALANFVSHEIYGLISDCSDYSSAIKRLKKHYVKPVNEIFARHKLATRKQKENESIADFSQSLELLAKECNFSAVTASEHASEAIRDAFINGLSSNAIRLRLLENEKLGLDSAILQAQALELAQRNASSYFSDAYSATASVGTPNRRDESCTDDSSKPTDVGDVCAVTVKRCYFCGSPYHQRRNCPAKDATCRKCNKLGHFARVCRSMEHAVVTKPGRSANVLLCSTDVSALSQAVMTIILEGKPCLALVDSGSTDNFISSDFAMKHKLELHPCERRVTMAANDRSSRITGKCVCSFVFCERLYPDQVMFVLPNLCTDVILGHTFLQQHSSVKFNFNGNQSELVLNNFAKMEVSSVTPFANLTPDCRPIATPSRRYSSDDTEFIGKEVAFLLKEGIIEPSCSPWRAQVVITRNPNNKKRMVIDFSTTVNRFTLLDAYPLPMIDDLVAEISKFRVFSKLDLQHAYYQLSLDMKDRPYTAFQANNQLYQFTRLPFGLTNAVACFQRTMNDIIEKFHLRSTFAYLDDVIICGSDTEDHDSNLKAFMKCVDELGITLREEKCIFRQSEITYLGYHISDGMMRPDPARVKPLRDLLPPENTKQMEKTIGLFSYYSKWIPRFSEKIQPLRKSKFPIDDTALSAFEALKKDVEKAFLHSIDPNVPFVVETDASEHGLAATLSQAGRPVAYYTRTLSMSERHYPSIEKEAAAIVESLRKWRHLLLGRHFTVITDQQSVKFMFSKGNGNRIKNEKLLRWRIELSSFNFDIEYRQGKENVCADALSRLFCNAATLDSLREIHGFLSHPGVRRLLHYVRSKNLPFSTADVRNVCANCKICAEIKPQFFKPVNQHLIKSTQPMERLSIDFVGPKESSTRNKYLLTVVDEHSRFPFVFPCSDLTSGTVINCLRSLFSVTGCPESIHHDRGRQFLSREVQDFLTNHGVAQTRTTPYNPRGNGQCERFNQSIWKGILLRLRDLSLPVSRWEDVLPDVLHSLRSLLSTATNETPHDRFFRFNRRSGCGTTLPLWLRSPGPVFLRRYVRNSKNDPLVEEVDLLHSNDKYAIIRSKDGGREDTVSLRDLAPIPRSDPGSDPPSDSESSEADFPDVNLVGTQPRRSERVRSQPDRLHYYAPGECRDTTL